MSWVKERDKFLNKVENITQDKDERAEKGFETIQQHNIKLVDSKTGAALTQPVDGIGRIPAGEGNELKYYLDEYKDHGYIPLEDFVNDHNPLHTPTANPITGDVH